MAWNGRSLFTSESVTEGHPDKIADQISDAVLDAILAEDPNGRVACETLVTTGLIVVAGEITTKCAIDIPQVARETVRGVGYTRAKYGFDCDTCAVICTIDQQSADIALGVDTGGAGDQGLMFGFACNETPQLMPTPILLAHQLTRQLARCRKDGRMVWLRPDGKSQVTVEYEGGSPVRVDTVVVSAQHGPDVSNEEIKTTLEREVIRPIIPPQLWDERTKVFINPTGRFVRGGPQGDCGLTGRKIIVDTYGGVGSHGGGAFSGKDPSKVDRSACYMARYIAKNCVAAGLADRLAIQLAYAIGVSEPVSIMVDSYGTGKISDENIRDLIWEHFPLTPHSIIDSLQLRRPIYQKTASYGHFGRDDEDFSWERTDRADALREAVNLAKTATQEATTG